MTLAIERTIDCNDTDLNNPYLILDTELKDSIAKKFAHYRKLGCLGSETLIDLFLDVVEVNANAVAIVDQQEITYTALLDAVNRTAAGFIEGGIAEGEPVVMHLANDVQFIIIFLGLLRSGAVPVLALPAHRGHELSHLINISGARSMVVSVHQGATNCSEMITAVIQKNPTITNVFTVGDFEGASNVLSFRDTAIEFPAPRPDSIAFFLLSGGTTGLPKLIPRHHSEYVYNCQLSAENATMDSDTRYLALLPMAHNYTLGCPGILGALFAGGTVYTAPDVSVDMSFEMIERYQITHCPLVPSLASLWVTAKNRNKHNLRSLTVLQVGGATVSPTLADQIDKLTGGALQQSYGMSEGLLCQTYYTDENDVLINSQGRPLSPYDEIRIVDDIGKEIVTRPAKGEMQTRGPYTIVGYFNAPDQNARTFTSDGYFSTGDLVSIRKDGTVVVEGRLNDVINRGGDKIGPLEIEDCLMNHPAIVDVAVVGYSDEIMGQRICAVLVCKKAIKLIHIRNYLRDLGLAEYKLPDMVMRVDEIPKSGFGKHDRKTLVASINVENKEISIA